MKIKKTFNKTKGSVLIAVIGILAVMSVMALRFNVEMETAMIKTADKNLASDVKSLAISGINYCIALLLKDGESCNNFGGKNPGYERPQLEMEEDLESIDRFVFGETIVGGKNGCSGVPFPVFQYSADKFYAGKSSTFSQGFVPDHINLSPGILNFMIEDLSAKLPAGRVSQWYQRHLISSVLSKLLTNSVPTESTDVFKMPKAELYEDIEITNFNQYDKWGNRYVFLRSLIPFNIAYQLPFGQLQHKNYAGLPLADGILVGEELGSSYTWARGNNDEKIKTIATDYPRGMRDYRLLSEALTPFARMSFDKSFLDVTYASINPMVMSRQNARLYNALFNYEPKDLRLKLYGSVGFPPKSTLPVDDNDPTNLTIGIADEKFFENNINAPNNGIILSAMPPSTIVATTALPSLPFTYNARIYAFGHPKHKPLVSYEDKHELPSDAGFFKSKMVEVGPPVVNSMDSSHLQIDPYNSWKDAEFLDVPNIQTAYYVAMAKAFERLSRAFKGSGDYVYPADNAMLPIMTRQSLELAIIQAVFGDSILFVVTDENDPSRRVFLYDYVANEETVAKGFSRRNQLVRMNYKRIHNALHKREIDLSKVLFVDNAYSKISGITVDEKSLSDNYFVPFWEHYAEHSKSSRYPDPGTSIKVPAFGLHYDGASYFNLLPHPQTDQRKLDSVFTTFATVFTKKVGDDGLLHATGSSGALDARKLYNGLLDNSYSGGQDISGNTAYLDLTTAGLNTIVSAEPSDDFSRLFLYNENKDHFLPADFTPYETKIRMAVLVNLLNAIIPEYVTNTDNFKFSDPPTPSNPANETLFSKSNTGTAATNLKDFIYCEYDANDKTVYKINTNANPGQVPYLNGWQGGIQTPGMTFWKYGVHSTTFQITVDAYKYDDSARVSTVITFDTENGSGIKLSTQPNYDLATATKELLRSAIFLNPAERAGNSSIGAGRKADNFVIGNGQMRYPTVTNTDSWRTLSFVWSSPFGKTGAPVDDNFIPIFLFPSDVANIGPAGGSWFFVPNPSQPTPFTKFYMDINGKSYLSIPGWVTAADYSTGALESRKRSFGAGSWLKWKANFSKDMTANTLNVMITKNAANGNSGITMKHNIQIIESSTGNVVSSLTLNTINGNANPATATIPVAIKKGSYVVQLTELDNSNTGDYGDEQITRITIYAK